MRLAALQSVLCTGPAGLSGYPRPWRRRGFPRAPMAPRPVSSPASLRRRVHPLLSLASSSECEPLRTCPRLDARTPPLGSRSQSRHQPGRSTCGQGSHPRSTFRPRCFAHPRRLALSSTSGACFIPQPRPGFTSQGFVPATESGRLIDGSCPPVVGHPVLPTRRGTAPDPVASPSGRRSGWRSAAIAGMFGPCGRPIPSQVLLHRVHLRASWRGLHPTSTRGLRCQDLRVGLAAGLQRLDRCPS